MRKRYIVIIIAIVVSLLFFINILFSGKPNTPDIISSPRIGQKLWTYNMNKYEWREYSDRDDENSKSEIILQYQGLEIGNGYTSYKMLTDNFQVPKEDVWIGEGSQEFIIGKNLYSYYPKTFEYYEVLFNGVKFITRKLQENEISDLFKNYQIIRLSNIEKGNFTIQFSKNKNRYIIFNDGDNDFYKYYIVPNDSKKMEIDRFSNQIKINNPVDIRIQRLEGCSKAYPCYEFSVKE